MHTYIEYEGIYKGIYSLMSVIYIYLFSGNNNNNNNNNIFHKTEGPLFEIAVLHEAWDASLVNGVPGWLLLIRLSFFGSHPAYVTNQPVTSSPPCVIAIHEIYTIE